MYCLLFRLIEYQFHNRLQPVIYLHPNTRVFVLALNGLILSQRCSLADVAQALISHPPPPTHTHPPQAPVDLIPIDKSPPKVLFSQISRQWIFF